ncbi:ankyrin repeat domain-containing protein 35 isoform 2-T3 [Morphnus guianensis]
MSQKRGQPQSAASAAALLPGEPVPQFPLAARWGRAGGPIPAASPRSCLPPHPQVESWNKQDQKLLEAVEKGDVGRVSALASRKTARPAKLNAMGQSAFHLAASKGLTECLTLLLAHGAPINEKNDDGKWRTPWGHLLVCRRGDTAKSEPGQGPVPVSPPGDGKGLSIDPHPKALSPRATACPAMPGQDVPKARCPLGGGVSLLAGSPVSPSAAGAQPAGLLQAAPLCIWPPLPASPSASRSCCSMVPTRAMWMGRTEPPCTGLPPRAVPPACCCSVTMRPSWTPLTLTALTLACEHRSLESAELLLSHGAVVGDEDCWHYTGQTPSHVLRQLLRSAHGGGRGESPPAIAPTYHHPYSLAWLLILGGKKGKRGLFLFLLAENGAGCAGDPAPQVGSQEEGTLGSDSEKEDEEDEEQQDGSDAWRVQRLQARLARKTRECQRLAATAASIWQQVRDLARLLPGCKARDGTKDEDGACLTLLAQHMGELRKRMLAEGDGGHQTMAQLDGDDGVLVLAPFLTWLGDECTKMRAAKASAFTRSKGLRKEVEEALRSKLHYEVVSADAVRRSLAAWEKMVVGLEQTLSRADETHAKMLQGSRALLENLQREPVRPLARTAPCQCPVNGTEPAPGGKSQEELPREGGNLEKEMLELKESNGMLLGELARLGRERERLQEELRGLREQDPDAEPVAEGAGAAALARALAAEREEAARLRQRLAGQRWELAVLRDGVGKQVQEAAGDASAGILRELHLKLDGLVRSQHEALQLVAEMEGEGTLGEGAPHSDGDGGAGLLGELEDALGQLVEELGTASGPHVPRLLERLAGTAATLRGWAFLGEQREQLGAEAERWRVAAAEEKRAKEAAVAQAAEREREARELQEKAEGLERSVGSLRARTGELSRACRDKEGKMKKLLAETEKLSAEVLGLRGQSARLQLQLEVQQKNHRDIVAVYRTHLLNAAQGFMDEGVHAMLMRILRMEE